jgi:2-keto-4-pentenoate hydratase/2-oxohepta-3-ene-1,7-dioic acid hydratase in catechol pathway
MQRLDWEAELVAVTGRRADTVTPEQALDYVAGYTVANDLSCRDERAMSSGIFGIHWLLQKGWRGLKPVGPAIVPARFVPDPGALRIRLSVNDEIRQVLTGTPAGTAAAHGHRYLTPGDHVVAEIEGLGQLTTRIAGG